MIHVLHEIVFHDPKLTHVLSKGSISKFKIPVNTKIYVYNIIFLLASWFMGFIDNSHDCCVYPKGVS